MSGLKRILVVALCAISWGFSAQSPGTAPRSLDDRLVIELVAEHPQIVTPTGLAVDAGGRVFVAESHTHFRPDDYDGPAADRILLFEDRDGDGRVEPPTVFHEGFVFVMDIEFHHDGSLYVATRKDIHRLRDTNQDGRADEITPIVRLETKGNYPHNGLSGIAFHFDGSFQFGLGENLGEPYVLIGSDGRELRGGAEGGSTYHVAADGSRLRRVTTGWWNPYGLCTDSFGRAFGTDNDPDSSPPCRLIQVVEEGDYGYEFRYGRSGRNPLITWNGEIPGTLPMIAGTGEAPCHLVAYESDALPEEYFGNLLVPTWADHRVERYVLTQRADRGLLETKRQVLIEGPDDFRPVGIDAAPDGSIYLSDWVSSSYTLHKQGRLWRIRPRQPQSRKMGEAAADRLLHADRRIRESAARELSSGDAGRKILRKMAATARVPVAQATAIAALAAASPPESRSPLDLATASSAVQTAAAKWGLSRQTWSDASLPVAVRAALLEHAPFAALPQLAESLGSSDPWLQHAARGALARWRQTHAAERATGWEELAPLTQLLVLKRGRDGDSARAAEILQPFFECTEPLVRLSAVKWTADDRLTPLRPSLEQLLSARDLDLRTFLGISVALDRLDGKPVTDRPTPDRLRARVLDPQASIPLRQWCLRLVDPSAAKLHLTDLSPLVDHPDSRLRLESIRTISRLSDPKKFAWLDQLSHDTHREPAVRAEAVAGLSSAAETHTETLVRLAQDPSATVRDEALRALVGVNLPPSQVEVLRKLAGSSATPHIRAAVARIVDRQAPQQAAATETARWVHFLAQPGDPVAGQRIFLGTKVGRCASCHQADGLGASVGPDLSQISERVHSAPDGRTWLLETILQPSRDMAPQFTPWQIVTQDGKQYLGLPRRKGGDSEAYLGTDGREFSLKVATIELRQEATVSIMPVDLLQQLTDQELADLFAFLLRS